jgi:hypothetical protein
MKVSGQLHTLTALLSGKEPPEWRLGVPPSLSDRDGEEENVYTYREQDHCLPARRLVTVLADCVFIYVLRATKT